MKTLRQQLKDAQAEVQRLKKMARCKRSPIEGWLGGVIQKHREANGWTIHQLSKLTGVAIGLLSRIEAKTDANPTLNNLLKIARAFGVPLSKFMEEWEDEIKAPKSTCAEICDGVGCPVGVTHYKRSHYDCKYATTTRL